MSNLLLLFSVIALQSFHAQSAAEPGPATMQASHGLTPITEIIKRESASAKLNLMLYQLAVEAAQAGAKLNLMKDRSDKIQDDIARHGPKPADGVADEFSTWVKRPTHPNGDALEQHEARELARAAPAVLEFLNSVAETYTGLSTGFQSSRIARIGVKGDERVLIITSVSSNTVFDTLRTSAHSRAASAVKEIIFPVSSVLAQCGENAEVDYVGIVAVYGAGDFGRDRIRASGEAVTVVAKLDVWRRLGALEITDREFLELADVYLADAGGTRKATIEMK